MNLLLQREQRRKLFGTFEYVLHIQLACNDVEHQIIEQHKLMKDRLFEVDEAEEHRKYADQAFEKASNYPLFGDEPSTILTESLTGVVHKIKAQLAFCVTVADALAGASIACPSLRHIVRAEHQITEAFDALYLDVQNAERFSTGHERVFEPDGAPEPEIITPAQWANRQLWRQ